MPIYEYKCDSCDYYLEVLQKVSELPLTQCPQCKDSSLRKLVSAVAFKLKGTGWYETDFKDKKPDSKKDQEKTKDETKDKEGASASTKKEQVDKKEDKKEKIAKKPKLKEADRAAK